MEKQVPPPTALVLNLTDIPFLSSSALSVLVEHNQRCRDISIDLHIVAGSRYSARFIAKVGLTEVLSAVSSLGEAFDATR